MYCSKCGEQNPDDSKFCYNCGTALVQETTAPQPTQELRPHVIQRERGKAPGLLWILPIGFGLLGGIIAALMVADRYTGSWWEYIIVGLITSGLFFFIYMFLIVESLF